MTLLAAVRLATRRGGVSAVLLAFVTSTVLGGCTLLAPRPDPSRFFVLSAIPSTSNSAGGGNLSIGVGPIIVPDYLSRSEMVIRTSATQIRPSQIDIWAEPISLGVTRVLAQNLSVLLGTERIICYPAYAVTRADWQVLVELVHFELDTQNAATLTARWGVRDRRSGKIVVARETNITRPATGPNTADGVAALSATLADLSGAIADQLRQLNAAAQS